MNIQKIHLGDEMERIELHDGLKFIIYDHKWIEQLRMNIGLEDKEMKCMGCGMPHA